MSDLPYHRIKTTLDRVLGGFLVALMAITVLNVLWQVAKGVPPEVYSEALQS